MKPLGLGEISPPNICPPSLGGREFHPISLSRWERVRVREKVLKINERKSRKKSSSTL
jgi:hypothetical protein